MTIHTDAQTFELVLEELTATIPDVLAAREMPYRDLLALCGNPSAEHLIEAARLARQVAVEFEAAAVRVVVARSHARELVL